MKKTFLTEQEVRAIIDRNWVNFDPYGMVKQAEEETKRKIFGAALDLLAAACIAGALLCGALAYFDVLTK